jgi:hypothetical protein
MHCEPFLLVHRRFLLSEEIFRVFLPVLYFCISEKSRATDVSV